MKNGTRCSTSRAYLHPIRDRKNLHVKKMSMVTKVLIDPITKLAYGVEYVRRGVKRRVFARKEIIVSSGAINSPQLLMLSGIGPKEQLEQIGIEVMQDSPVGQNLMDHVALGGLTFLVNETVSLKTERILDDAMALNDFMSSHKGPITIPGGSEALAFYDLSNPRNPDGYPDLELLFNAGGITSDPTLKRGFGLTDFVYNSVFKAIEEMDGIMILPMVMRPKSKGEILLRDKNPFHHPLIYPNYFSDPADLDVLVKGVRLSQDLMKTKWMQKLSATLWDAPLPSCRKIQFDSDEYWKCAARQLPFTIYHLAGTCKMAPEQDPTSVVNPRLRVKGIRGLRVADASIMPEVPAAHTNAPTIMIGEKVSDMIKEDWNML